MDIRVSYVVATKNRATFLKAALPRWEQLKGPHDELIVIDGDSTDGTWELLKSAPAGLIDRLVHEPDRSEAHAFNKGYLLARGRLIKGLTDDDLFFKNALDEAYQAMFERPEIDILITGGESVAALDGAAGLLPHHYQWIPDGTDLQAESGYVTMTGLGIILRRSSLAVTGLFDPRHVHADTSFLTQATVRGAHIRYMRVKGYRHVVGPQSLSSLHNMRKTYIYRDFNFRRLSRWRYLKQPSLALRLALQRTGLLKKAHPVTEPVWDGKIL